MRSSLSHNNTLTNAKKRNITYSSDRSSLLDELLLLFGGKSCFYSACLLPETNSNVSARNDLALLLGVSLSTRLTWLFTYEREGAGSH